MQKKLAPQIGNIVNGRTLQFWICSRGNNSVMCESLQMKNVLAYANFKFMTYVKFHSNYLRNSGHSSIHKLATLYADKPTPTE